MNEPRLARANRLKNRFVASIAMAAFVCTAAAGAVDQRSASVKSASFELVNGSEPKVSFSAEVLRASQPGDAVVFALGNSARIQLVTERLETGSGGAVTWVGYDPARGRSARTYITVLGEEVSGEIASGESRFLLSRAANSSDLLSVKDLGKSEMTRFFSVRPDYLRVDAEARRIARLESLDAQGDQMKATPTPQTTVDLAVVFTAGMVTRYGSVAGVVTRINQLVAAANDAYANSEVAITLRLVRTEQVAYPDTGDNGAALNAFSGFQTSPTFGEISPLPALAAAVRPIRNAAGADIMVLLRPLSQATHSGCGIAWLGEGNSNVTFDSQFGYAVVSDGSDGSFFCALDTFAHEIGHNMGLTHDRPNAFGEGATYFSYGYGVNYSGNTPNFGDIMSYASNRVPFFSSPNLRCNTSNGSCTIGGAGVPLGVAGDTDTGTCTTNPTTCADAARTLNLTRAYIASYRAAVGVTISGTISSGTGVAGVTFCARPATGVNCTASNGAGVYSCTVPTGWAGTLHSPSVAGNRIPAQVFAAVSANTTRNVTAITGTPSCNLDVDNNGLFEPATDGMAILRRMLGANSAAFSGLSGTCATNTTATAIFNATSSISGYNVTGGTPTRPSTDGLVILRAMRGLTNTAVTDGLGLAASGAIRTDWNTLRTYMNSTCGANF